MIPTVGVLALQGDVREHAASLAACGVEVVPVRRPDELAAVHALVLPGGESTTMSRLLSVFGLEQPLRERLASGMPTLSTCAGLILLSREIRDGRPDQAPFGLLDVVVRRNGYGRQVESFEADVTVEPLGVAPLRAVFIRAPRLEEVGDKADIIARYAGEPVAVSQGPHLGLAFHPEMTGDLRIHQLFVDRVEEHLEANAA